MSINDSSALIDSPAAGRLGENRALYFNEEQGKTEKFRPYGLPEQEWLDRARDQLLAKPKPVGYNNNPPEPRASSTPSDLDDYDPPSFSSFSSSFEPPSFGPGPISLPPIVKRTDLPYDDDDDDIPPHKNGNGHAGDEADKPLDAAGDAAAG
jgi:hypothetical protein